MTGIGYERLKPCSSFALNAKTRSTFFAKIADKIAAQNKDDVAVAGLIWWSWKELNPHQILEITASDETQNLALTLSYSPPRR